jgi:hypothetical protein
MYFCIYLEIISNVVNINIYIMKKYKKIIIGLNVTSLHHLSIYTI